MSERITFRVIFGEAYGDPMEVTLTGSGARDCMGIAETEHMACESVRRFIEDYFGHECVNDVEIERPPKHTPAERDGDAERDLALDRWGNK